MVKYLKIFLVSISTKFQAKGKQNIDKAIPNNNNNSNNN